jgi:hypothetical protein
LAVRNADVPYLNRVMGLDIADNRGEDVLDDVLDWYKEHGVAPLFDAVGGIASSAVLRRLAERGFYQSGFTTAVYGCPSSQTYALPPGVTLRIAQEADAELFGDVYVSGFGFTGSTAAFFKRYIQRQIGYQDRPCYLVFVDEQAAGMGTLYTRAGIGTLGAATILPAFRQRGGQLALLRQRIAATAELECDLIVSQTSAGSGSQRNMERVGLRIAYVKATWIALHWPKERLADDLTISSD